MSDKAREHQLAVFKKELRYYVIKRKHLKSYDEGRVINLLQSLDLPEIECVVVEHDWPMYHDVWDMIRRYVETGKYESQQREIDRLREELAAAVGLIKECDEYLDTNKMTYIGHMSILHRNMKEIAQQRGVSE